MKTESKKEVAGNVKIQARPLYIFDCVGCNKPRRTTFKLVRADKGLCRKCRKEKLIENTIPMF